MSFLLLMGEINRWFFRGVVWTPSGEGNHGCFLAFFFPEPSFIPYHASAKIGAWHHPRLITVTRIIPCEVFLVCLLAGCSICWFNTICFVLCIKNFPMSRAVALSLTISFNGVSAALFSLVAKTLGSTSSVYLLLNATLPLLASAASLPPILRYHHPVSSTTVSPHAATDNRIFLWLFALAFVTGLYLLFINSVSTTVVIACFLLVGALSLLLFPLCIPCLVCSHSQESIQTLQQLHKPFIDQQSSAAADVVEEDDISSREGRGPWKSWWCYCCCDQLMAMDRLSGLSEEHGVKQLMRRVDFWLYYLVYLCGATVGLVYSNNLGQIAQSLGKESQTTTLVTVYSSCSFFGRLFSAAPDFLTGKAHFARTGWLVVAQVLTPVAFFLLAESGDGKALLAGTALVGLSSGFVFAAAVSVTSDLFGPNSVGVNHNILITNIPVGSLLYGVLAALYYDANGVMIGDGMVVCMGRECYAKTFVLWGCISLFGLACSVVLYLRTRLAYEFSDRRRSPAALVDRGAIDNGVDG
ncbi:protein NUCLEAR FUSION DEFECTIVE 4-like isoform X2 [Dioscorea cayenensis subsp. rotundata]|uniref:Protein NUCLEAR FUSION DEFECTIVE 4-like isoform X2 n=1 Tax=Dioscorea cayennensis subsp. rotundata TaxID=55577 RepID=A0AB40CN06_DIOCR|nr:protein NUCLEAR FUSION DEFECTIVE 4-like isoform X2 [Dioscorea cayenensis subsp. rotundata]